ncbi:MAG: NUDIX domain-containing protein [Actinobacteria bacterium]|nr:NUDIX domain-containing protein [Actinomycetota bacterium]
MTRRGGREVLLVHRAPKQGGYWHVVAGGVESGETLAGAAERELHEETGLVAHVSAGVGVVEYVYPLTEEPAERRKLYDPSVVRVEVTCFCVAAPDDWEPTLDWEHDGHRWCGPADAFTTLRWPDTAQALRKLLALELQERAATGGGSSVGPASENVLRPAEASPSRNTDTSVP